MQIVKLLSSVDESKTVINSKDDEGWAPLHSATSIGKAELVEILLTRGLCFNLVSFLYISCVIFLIRFKLYLNACLALVSATVVR